MTRRRWERDDRIKMEGRMENATSRRISWGGGYRERDRDSSPEILSEQTCNERVKRLNVGYKERCASW